MAFDIKKSTVYFRDKLVPFGEANVSIASSPVLYGLSIYTVLPLTWNSKDQTVRVFRLKDHFKRLVNSAKIMDFNGFVDTWDYQKFESMVVQLVRDNNIRQDALVRITVFIDELFAGTRMHGLTNSVSACIYSTNRILPAEGAKVCVSSWQRNSDNAVPSRAKANGSYVNASLMKNEALLNGYDDAIAIDVHGHVSEGTVTNLFMVRGGVLITPDSATDLLEGITRDTVLSLAEQIGLPSQVRCVDRSELYIADEVFFSGSSAGICPIISIDKRKVGNGRAGKLTKQISELYTKALRGDNKQFGEWVSRI